MLTDQEFLELDFKVRGICPLCRRAFAAKKDPNQLKKVPQFSTIHDEVRMVTVHPLVYGKCRCKEKAKKTNFSQKGNPFDFLI